MMQQDSNDPSGVRDDSERGNSEVARSRNRKANAALQLVNSGANWIEVAETLGFPTPRDARVAVERALEKELHEGDREQLRRFASSKLDRLLRGVWKKAISEDDPEHLPAVREARAIVEQQVKLWGLAAPSEVTVYNATQQEIETWVTHVITKDTPQLEEADIFDVDVVEDEAS